MYYVYGIYYDNQLIYVGRTNNLNRRQYQHNYNLRKGKDKLLYNYCREKKVSEIILKVLYQYKNKADSKRMEILIIITDHFGDKKLKQKVPNISDR